MKFFYRTGAFSHLYKNSINDTIMYNIRIGDPIYNCHDLERGHDHSIVKDCMLWAKGFHADQTVCTS